LPQPHGKTGNAPDHGRHGREFDRPHIVIGLAVDGRRRQLSRTVVITIDDGEDGRRTPGGEEIRVKDVFRRVGIRGDEDRSHCERNKGERRSSLADSHGFSRNRHIRHLIPLCDASSRGFRSLQATGSVGQPAMPRLDSNQTAATFALRDCARNLRVRVS
jgi:hypothetical protein